MVDISTKIFFLYPARRAVIVTKPQASAWGQAKDSVASKRRVVIVSLPKIENIKLNSLRINIKFDEGV